MTLGELCCLHVKRLEVSSVDSFIVSHRFLFLYLYFDIHLFIIIILVVLAFVLTLQSYKKIKMLKIV